MQYEVGRAMYSLWLSWQHCVTDTRGPTGHEMDIVPVFYIPGAIIYNILILLLSPMLPSSHTSHNMELLPALDQFTWAPWRIKWVDKKYISLRLSIVLLNWKDTMKVVFKMLYSLLSRKMATAYSDKCPMMAQNYSDKNECQSTINHGAVNGKFIFPFMNHKAKILYSISR